MGAGGGAEGGGGGGGGVGQGGRGDKGGGVQSTPAAPSNTFNDVISCRATIYVICISVARPEHLGL